MMNARESAGEKISALVDGEVNYCAIDSTLTAVRDRNAQITWDVYHHIGDILRSEKNAGPPSDAFMQRFKMRFENELPHGQPVRVVVDIPKARPGPTAVISRPSILASLFSRRFVIPGAAALVAGITVFVNSPALTTADVTERPASLEAISPSAGILKAGNDAKTVAVRLADPTPVSITMPELETLQRDANLQKSSINPKDLSAPVYKDNLGTGTKASSPYAQK